MDIRPYYKGTGLPTNWAVQTGRVSGWEPQRQNGLMMHTPFTMDGEEWLRQTGHPSEARPVVVPDSSVPALPEM